MRKSKNKYLLHNYSLLVGFSLAAWLLLAMNPDKAFGQNDDGVTSYKIRDGRMYIKLGKHIDEVTLDQFVKKYDLSDLDLPKVLFSGDLDKIRAMGWRVDIDNKLKLVISKKIGGLDQLGNPEKRMALTEDHPNPYDLFPSQNDDLVYGFNRFEDKLPFAVKDSLVTFFLKGSTNARQALLAGSFTNWQHGELPMTRTDSGWICVVKLNPGKYWYKFIVDGGWTIDHDNDLHETDPNGNTNSVYYKSNVVFSLTGYAAAKDAYLAAASMAGTPANCPWKRPHPAGKYISTWRKELIHISL